MCDQFRQIPLKKKVKNYFEEAKKPVNEYYFYGRKLTFDIQQLEWNRKYKIIVFQMKQNSG